MTWWLTPGALVIFVLGPLVLVAFATFTSLVKWQHANHRAAWEADGRPSGYFWNPASGLFARLGAHWAMNVVMLRWLFTTPAWAEGDQRARRFLRRYRACVAIWNAGVIAAFLWSRRW